MLVVNDLLGQWGFEAKEKGQSASKYNLLERGYDFKSLVEFVRRAEAMYNAFVLIAITALIMGNVFLTWYWIGHARTPASRR